MANGLWSFKRVGSAGVFAAFALGNVYAQVPQAAGPGEAGKAAPLAFEVVSVKAAPPETAPSSPAFVRDKGARTAGVQRMVAPVNMLAGYAYGMQMSEDLAAFRKQADWTRNKLYTVTFRAGGEPTREQVREMMRTMLAERFGLEIHQFTRDGAVDRLVMDKPGVLGPNLKPHPAGASCVTQDSSALGHAPDPGSAAVAHCGLSWYYLPGGVVHEEMNDISMAALGLSLASRGDSGLGKYPVVDATGLVGKYDLTLEFRPGYLSELNETDDAPTLMRALKEQLGIRVESGQGPVRMFVVDRVIAPTAD